MSLGFLLPALVVAGLATLAGSIRWPLPPVVAAPVLSVIAAAGSVTLFSMAVVTAVGFAARSALVFSLISWCPLVPLHHEVGALEGSAAFVLLIVAITRMYRVLERRRWAARGTAGRTLALLDTAEPIAYAAPGRPGCVVVSQGMLAALDSKERQVLFAHERAHLDQRHHRFLLTSELAVAVLPSLRPLAEQVRLATERCADEAAADVMGNDRRLVARSIAKAAVRAHEHRDPVGAFGGGSVPMRVQALLGPGPSAAAMRTAVLSAGAVVVLALLATGIQIHHVVELVAHVCDI